MRPCVIPAPPCRHSRTHPPSFPRKRESRVGSQAGGACFTYTTSLSAGSYAKVSEGGNPGAGAAGSPARPLMVSRSFLLTLKTVAAEGCAPINRRPQHTLPPQSRRAATPLCHPPLAPTGTYALAFLQQTRPGTEVPMPPAKTNIFLSIRSLFVPGSTR